MWGSIRVGDVSSIEESNGTNFLISSFGSGIGLRMKYRNREKWKFELDAGGAFGFITKNNLGFFPFSKINEYKKPFVYPSLRLKIFWILNL